jgi:hypothetical protein
LSHTDSIYPVAIAQVIRELRGVRVLLDQDLANLYGVEVRVLNQAVKRNAERFPDDFMFQISGEEFASLRSQLVISSPWGGRRTRPYAFTEQGVAMLSSVLRSERAVQVNIAVMRAFVQLRRVVAAAAPLEALSSRLVALESQVDATFQVVFDQLDDLRHQGGAVLTVQGPMVGNVVGLGSNVQVDGGRIPLQEVLRLVKAAPWQLSETQSRELQHHLDSLEGKPPGQHSGEVLKSVRGILENAAGGLLGEIAKAWLGSWF